jgi:GH25 family lysozyme M1 (1,4-beta-N-acetylmuramidase)
VIDGVDISSHQASDPVWSDLLGQGFRFIIFRSSEGGRFRSWAGPDRPDSRFAARWSGSRDSGLIRGSYHYFHTGRVADGTADARTDSQADVVVSLVGRLLPGELAPSLDLEEASVNNSVDASGTANFGDDASWSSANWIDRIGRFLDRLETALGRTPLIYTRTGPWRHHVQGGAANVPAAQRFAAYPLWVPHYRAGSDNKPNPVPPGWDPGQINWNARNLGPGNDVPAIWPRHAIFQHSFDTPRRFLGLFNNNTMVDFNVTPGTIHELRGLADLGKVSALVAGPLAGGAPHLAVTDEHGAITVRRAKPAWEQFDVGDLAGGDPSVYCVGSNVFVAYRARGGRLFSARLAENASEAAVDLLVSSIDDPLAVAVGGSIFILYRSERDELFALKSTDGRSWAEMPALVPGSVSGSPTVYKRQGELHVLVRVGDQGHLHDVTASGAREDLHARFDLPPATYRGAAIATANGRQLIAFRAVRGELWLFDRDLGEPSNANPVEAPDQLPAGSPVGFEHDGEVHLVFRTVANRLREAVRSAGGQWRLTDLGNQSCVADPSLYLLRRDAHVVFRAADGSVHEFVFDGAWRHELTN